LELARYLHTWIYLLMKSDGGEGEGSSHLMDEAESNSNRWLRPPWRARSPPSNGMEFVSCKLGAGRSFLKRERDLLLGHGHHPSVDKSKVNNVKLGVHKHKSCLASYWATDFQTRQTCAFFRLQRIPSQMVIRVSTTANLQQDGYGSSSNDKHEASCTVQQNNNSSSMCLYPLALFFHLLYYTAIPRPTEIKIRQIFIRGGRKNIATWNWIHVLRRKPDVLLLLCNMARKNLCCMASVSLRAPQW